VYAVAEFLAFEKQNAKSPGLKAKASNPKVDGVLGYIRTRYFSKHGNIPYYEI
jgi:hypothetical protein